MEIKKIFTPIKIGQMEVKNRFVVPPMGTNFADRQGFVTQQLLDYYEARAKGGFGMIIVEVTAVTPTARSIPNEVGVWSDDHIEGLRKLVAVAHKHGAKIILQLHHAGRQTFYDTIEGKQPEAPSAVSCPFCNVIPRELSTQEVYDLISHFGDAAVRAKKAGFDGVEVHGAHGYLIAQFMSAHSNKRLDEFGGDLISRMKFPLDIIQNIRSKVGNDYPVMFRYSAEERYQDGIELNEARVMAQMLEDASINALHVSVCSYGSLEWMSVPSNVPAGYNLHTATAIKEVVDIPIITVGRINDPYLAESVIANNTADLISFGRESICEPALPNKMKAGLLDEISPCISCEQSCHGYLFGPHVTISCLVNPFTGNEGKYNLDPAPQKKKVLIAGAGPAGLFSAWVAAAKGHDVTLYDKRNKLGGEFRIASIPPSKQVITKAIKYYEKMCRKYGVNICLNTEVNNDLLQSEKPDAVILATGSKPLLPPIPGINNDAYLLPSAILDGKVQPGKKVLIAGGGLIAAELADFLGERGHDITMIEMKPEIAMDAHMYITPFLMKSLSDHGVNMITNAVLTEFSGLTATYKKDDKLHKTGEFDNVVLALGTVSNNSLLEAAGKITDEVYVIGDAEKAGTANHATETALAVAATL